MKNNISIDTIQQCVVEATDVKITDILMGNKIKGARKKERINARHISMKLSKKYTKFSLSRIGAAHGGRDHASVLHACSSIDNLLDTKDEFTKDTFSRSEALVLKKITIRSHRIIFRRELPITAHGKRCSCCHNPINHARFKTIY